MAHLSVTLLGPPLVTLNRQPVTGFDSDKVRGLLAYLIVKSDRPHRREKLAGLLWPDYAERSARTSLRSALANLRQVIGDQKADPPFLLITRQTIQFNQASEMSLDVSTFLSLISKEASQPADLTAIEEAVRLYKGAFMEGFSLPDSIPFEDWLVMNREFLQGQVLQALHRLAGYHQEKGSNQQALQFARQQLELDFYQEAAHQQVMWSLAQSGQRNEALVQYERLRELLDDELGVKPLESTQAMYEQLLNGEIPSPPMAIITLRREPLEVGECPYRGLAAFREQDAPFFFGREGFTAKISEAFRKRSLVAVIVGSSGSGKSSTIFAGLVPKLHAQGNWLILHLRPRSYPFLSLAGAFLPILEPNLGETDQMVEIQRMADRLGEGDLSLQQVVIRTLENCPDKERMLLIIDQFEELYTLCPEPEVRRRFLDELLETVESGTEPRTSPFMLLLTLRADFMGQALTHRHFADALQDNTIILSPMNRAELRAAIEKPAEQQGAAFESGLVARILDDVGEEPGNLPLLEFALALLWERLDQGWATHAAYEDIGRVEGALARYADEVYVELADKDQEMAHQAFIQLVQPGQGTEDTRRVAIRTEMGAERWSLIQHLADKRLVVTGRDESGHETVELVHEALIWSWQRLREWLDEDRSFRTWQESIRVALRQWESSNRDEGALLRGAPLTQAENWRAERSDCLSTSETEFIQISLDLQEQEQGRHQQRRRRTIFGLAAGLVVALVLVLLIGLQWSRAEDASALARAGQATAQANAEARATHQAIAEEQSRIATSRELAAAALANLGLDPQRGLLLALKSVDETFISDGTVLPEAENALHRAVHSAYPQQVLSGEDPQLYYVAYNPDGTHLVTWGYGEFPGTTRVWNATTGELNFSLPGIGWEISLDGKRLAIVVPDFQTFEYSFMFSDSVTGDFISSVGDFPNFDLAITSQFDQNWNFVAIPYWNGIIEIWDLSSAQKLHSLGFEGRAPDWSVAFSPDGQHLAAGNQDGILTVWDWDDDDELFSIPAHTSAVQAITYNPDGSLLATAGSDSTAKLWDVENGEELATLSGHANEVYQLDFSPSGDLLATGSYDHLVKIWDVKATLTNGIGKEKLTLVGHQQLVTYLDFSPDENYLASVSEDGTLRIWDITADANSEGFVFVNGEGPGPSYGVSLSLNPDGTRMAAANSDSEPKIWDTSTGHLLHTLSGHEDRVEVIEFSPDGVYVVTASHDNTIKIWDAAGGRTLSTISNIKCGEVDLAICDIGFSPDGKFLAIGDYEGVVQVFDFKRLLEHDSDATEIDGLLIKAHEKKVFSITYSPDGDQFATSSSDGSVKIWDADTGEQLLTLSGHDAWVCGIAYSPDGAHLATASADATALIWDVDTGESLFTLDGHSATIFRVTYSPDGIRIATASSDGTAKLWDAETGLELTTLVGHENGLRDVGFSTDGKQLYTASVDGTNRVFLLGIEELIALARSRLTRGFSEEECQRLLHMDKCPKEP